MKKIITCGKWKITHLRFIDDFGFESDSFEITNTETRESYPFRGYMKAANYSRDLPIGRIPYTYTTNDYMEMMREQISKIQLYEKNK